MEKSYFVTPFEATLLIGGEEIPERLVHVHDELRFEDKVVLVRREFIQLKPPMPPRRRVSIEEFEASRKATP